ncbi:MAG: flagellar protein FlaG [Oceanospirillaceae bacterium]|nr:flagellar protein FlaG [Oceanospirillaceae bacterium]
MSLDIPSVSLTANIADTAPSDKDTYQAAVETKLAEHVEPFTKVEDSYQVGAILIEAVKNLNEFFSIPNRSIKFSIDKESQSVIVSVMDTENEEIIRQIPNEKALKLSEYIDGVIGLLFDETV